MDWKGTYVLLRELQKAEQLAAARAGRTPAIRLWFKQDATLSWWLCSSSTAGCGWGNWSL